MFSPAVKHTSIRILLSIVAFEDMKLEQLDVNTTFLHGTFEGIIYMNQTIEFEVSEKEGNFYRLQKSLCGLKWSTRCWYV